MVEGEQPEKIGMVQPALSKNIMPDQSPITKDLDEATNGDDETLTPEEEAAAQAAVRRYGRQGVPRRSVQYDNPELAHLVANGISGSKKPLSLARGSSFSEER